MPLGRFSVSSFFQTVRYAIIEKVLSQTGFLPGAGQFRKEEKMNQMTTEMRNIHTMDLDRMSSLEIITVMNKEDEGIPRAIHEHLEEIARVAEWGKETLQKE